MKVLSFGVLLFGLLAHSSAHAQQVDIRVNATPSIFADMFREIVNAFEIQNPDVSVTLDTSQRHQAGTFQNTLRQALVDDLPDVSFQGFLFLRLLSEAGHIQPLDDLIANDPDWTEAKYSPSVTNVGKVGEKIFGLGAALSFPVIYYNMDLVREAQGGSSDLPESWDEILNLAVAVNQRHPDVIGAYARYNTFSFYGHVMSGGGTIGNADGTEVTFTDENGMETFRRYRRFGELGQAQVDMTDSQVRQSFAGGKVAVLLDSSSSLGNYQKQAEGRFEIGTATFPFAQNAALPTSGVAVVLHATDDERRNAAWRFMRFVTGPEGQTIVGRMTGYVPANEVPIRTPGLLGDFYEANPAATAALESIAYAAPWYEFKGPNGARINELYADELQQLVTLRRTPEETAASLAEAVSALIEK